MPRNCSPRRRSGPPADAQSPRATQRADTRARRRQLAEELDLIEERGAAHVIVLTGAGGHFCAGLDLHWLRSLGAVPTRAAAAARTRSDFQSAVHRDRPLPAARDRGDSRNRGGVRPRPRARLRHAVRGVRRDASPPPSARMGLVPDGGSTFTLPRLVGLGHALRFLMTGETVSAERACALGLVDDVSKPDGELEAAVASTAKAIAAAAPASLRAIKRLVRAAELGGLEQALAAEGAAQIQALQSAGVSAPARGLRQPMIPPPSRSSPPTCWRGASRSSPAAAPGSVSASPPASPPPARRWPSRAGSRSTSTAGGRSPARTGSHGEHGGDQRAGARGGARRTVERVAEEHGRIDLLVNNAAGNFYAPSAATCRPTPGARWWRPISTAPSTAVRPCIR